MRPMRAAPIALTRNPSMVPATRAAHPYQPSTPPTRNAARTSPAQRPPRLASAMTHPTAGPGPDHHVAVPAAAATSVSSPPSAVNQGLGPRHGLNARSGHTAPAARPVVDQTERSVVVLAPDPNTGVHDSLWRVAERTLGDGDRWPEIFALNKNTPQPGGRT